MRIWVESNGLKWDSLKIRRIGVEKMKVRILLENPNYLRNGKTVISVKNPEFFLISDDVTDFTVEIV